MGDPSKLIILEKVIEVIKRDKLLEQTMTVGAELMKGLHELEVSAYYYTRKYQHFNV